MMRALWTAGSGMTAQQLNVDVIANNLRMLTPPHTKKKDWNLRICSMTP